MEGHRFLEWLLESMLHGQLYKISLENNQTEALAYLTVDHSFFLLMRLESTCRLAFELFATSVNLENFRAKP